MKTLRTLLLSLLLLAVALPAVAAPVDLNSGPPLSLNGLTLWLPQAVVRERLGAPLRRVDDQTQVYRDDAVVRIRDGKVVNLMVSDTKGHWRLEFKGKDLLATGAAQASVLSLLGKPAATYLNSKKPLQVLLYTPSLQDLGIMILDGKVVGFMLADPGVMAGSLTDTGYTLKKR